jgi:hypothetical protein
VHKHVNCCRKGNDCTAHPIINSCDILCDRNDRLVGKPIYNHNDEKVDEDNPSVGIDFVNLGYILNL